MGWIMKTISAALFLFVASSLVTGQEGPSGKPVAYWLERLRSNDLRERDEAVEAVGRIGTAARDAALLLRPLLKDGKPDTRFKAALALWNVLDDGTDPVAVLKADFAGMSQSRKQELRRYAFGRKKVDAALFALFELLMSEPAGFDPVLSHMATLGADIVPHYAKWMASFPGEVRADAIKMAPFPLVVASNGDLVAKYLTDADPACRVAAAAALLHVPAKRDEAAAALAEFAAAKDRATADAALQVLLGQPTFLPKAAPAFLQGLKNPRLDLRFAVVKPVLLLHPERADDVLPVLEEALKHESDRVRSQAYPLVAELGTKAGKFASLLLARIKDPEFAREVEGVLQALRPLAAQVRKEVGELLFDDPNRSAPIGPLSLTAFVPHLADELKKQLGGGDLRRAQIALRLVSVAPPEMRDALLPAVLPHLKAEATAPFALNVLAACGKAARPATAEIVALLDGSAGRPWTRDIRRVLRRIEPDPKLLDPVLDRVKAKAAPTASERLLAADVALLHPERRGEVADFLAPLLAEKDALLRGVDRGDPSDLVGVVNRLGPQDGKVVPVLRAYLKANPTAIFTLDKVLVRIGPAAKEVVPDLLAELKTQGDESRVLLSAFAIYALDPDRRGPADERIAELFLPILEREPRSEYLIRSLRRVAELCRTGPGPTKALLPLLLASFRRVPDPDIQADLAEALVRLDPTVEAEAVRTFEGQLGHFPTNPEGALVGLLRLRPDHPAALAAVKKFLPGAPFVYAPVAARVAMRCRRPLAGVREMLEAQLKVESAPAFKGPAYVALMRDDGKLNAAWIDEFFRLPHGDFPGFAVRDLRYLGPLAKTIVPPFRNLGADELQEAGYHEFLDLLRGAR